MDDNRSQKLTLSLWLSWAKKKRMNNWKERHNAAFHQDLHCEGKTNLQTREYNIFSFVCLFDLILRSQSTISQLCWDRSSSVEPALSKDKCVLLKDTTHWRWWGSNPQPLCLESSTIPLCHCAPQYLFLTPLDMNNWPSQVYCHP